MKKTVAIITARGGSKRLPGKNVRPLLGKPMIGYTIEAALKCELVQKTIVSTDDPEIKAVSASFGADVWDRPAKFATDLASSESVIQSVLEELKKRGEKFDRFVLLQPTSPLRTSQHLTECLSEMETRGAMSAFGVFEASLHPAKFFTLEAGWLKPFFGVDAFRVARAELPKAYRPNGALYAANVAAFERNGSLYQEPALPYVMSVEDSVDIDTLEDFNTCEAIMRRRQGKL